MLFSLAKIKELVLLIFDSDAPNVGEKSKGEVIAMCCDRLGWVWVLKQWWK